MYLIDVESLEVKVQALLLQRIEVLSETRRVLEQLGMEDLATQLHDSSGVIRPSYQDVLSHVDKRGTELVQIIRHCEEIEASTSREVAGSIDTQSQLMDNIDQQRREYELASDKYDISVADLDIEQQDLQRQQGELISRITIMTC